MDTKNLKENDVILETSKTEKPVSIKVIDITDNNKENDTDFFEAIKEIQ